MIGHQNDMLGWTCWNQYLPIAECLRSALQTLWSTVPSASERTRSQYIPPQLVVAQFEKAKSMLDRTLPVACPIESLATCPGFAQIANAVDHIAARTLVDEGLLLSYDSYLECTKANSRWITEGQKCDIKVEVFALADGINMDCVYVVRNAYRILQSVFDPTEAQLELHLLFGIIRGTTKPPTPTPKKLPTVQNPLSERLRRSNIKVLDVNHIERVHKAATRLGLTESKGQWIAKGKAQAFAVLHCLINSGSVDLPEQMTAAQIAAHVNSIWTEINVSESTARDYTYTKKPHGIQAYHNVLGELPK